MVQAIAESLPGYAAGREEAARSLRENLDLYVMTPGKPIVSGEEVFFPSVFPSRGRRSPPPAAFHGRLPPRRRAAGACGAGSRRIREPREDSVRQESMVEVLLIEEEGESLLEVFRKYGEPAGVDPLAEGQQLLGEMKAML